MIYMLNLNLEEAHNSFKVGEFICIHSETKVMRLIFCYRRRARKGKKGVGVICLVSGLNVFI